MFRKVLMLMAIVLGVWACSAQGGVIDSNWVGGESGYWETASNWNPAIVPDNDTSQTFFVTLDSGSSKYDIAIQSTHTVDRIICSGDIDLECVAFNVELKVLDGLLNNGSLHIVGTGRQTKFVGDIENTAGAEAILENFVIIGNTLNPDGALMICEDSQVTCTEDFNNSGNIMIVPYSELSIHERLFNQGKIEILGGGLYADDLLDNDSNGIIEGFGVAYGATPLTNNGIIYADGGTLSFAKEGMVINRGIMGNSSGSWLNVKHIDLFAGDPNVHNFGTIEINPGGSTFDDNLINEPNGIITLLGGTLAATTITQTADANFAGFGTITGDVLIDPDGLIKLTGPTNIIGDMQIGIGATLEISDGTTLITGHTTNNGTIHMKGGRIIPQGGFTNNGNIIWEPGTYNNIADFNLDGQVNFKDFADFADTWLWQALL
jgi:hypothetical protein